MTKGNSHTIIIGSGIGGLVCGCYLAKAKRKVTLIEQHYQAGGCCTSFTRNGFRFDAGVHYLGGIKKHFFGTILKELGIEIELKQFDPTDKVIIGNKVTYFRKNAKLTIREIKNNFPDEAENIDRFFTFILSNNFYRIYEKAKSSTFTEILNCYFKNKVLKHTLEILLSNIGLPANKFSAISAIVLYRDYLLEGGYYPKGGMQEFADCLARKFVNLGGKLLLGTEVNEIVVKKKMVKGIRLENGTLVTADYVVSNADAFETFKKLIKISVPEQKIVSRLKCSPSIFALYLGLTKTSNISNETCNVWYFPNKSLAEVISDLRGSILKKRLPYCMCTFPSAHTNEKIGDTMQFLMLAPYETEKFWNNYRTILAEKILDKAEEVFPKLRRNIIYQNTATPHTFSRYTLNRNGAAFGWASTVQQTPSNVFPQKTSLANLFLTGHWTTIGSGQGGIPKVAFSGRRTAFLILNR
jgi:phytoene dehydrogenase-like protein